jgi:dipeptidyl aminopeptidase/acylaminoacyl peptidase
MRPFFSLSLFLALLGFGFPVFAQAKHPFTFEDMMKLKRVGDPQVSPDGKWVIFSVVDVDLGANTKTPHIWIVPTAGGDEREIISDQDADRPRWAPHGKRFAFLSTKVGGSQVWVADFDGAAGTVTRKYKFTSIETEASGELWSPDGRNILFTSDVDPACDGDPEAEIACNAKRLKEREDSKVKALVFDHLLYRHWNAYKEGKRTHIFVSPLNEAISACLWAPGSDEYSCYRNRYRDLTPGDYDAPVFSLGGQDDYAFSPDGKEICYASNHDKNPAASTNNDLWIVPVTGGEAGSVQAKNITADNPASDSTPLYSPDGRYIAYRAQQRPGYESDRFRLMLYDRKTGEKKNLTEDFDRWVGSIAWSPDSKTVYLSAENEGYTQVFRVDVQSRNRVVLPACNEWRVRGTYADLQLSPDGKTLLASRNSIMSPNEIYGFDLTASNAPKGMATLCVSTDTPPVREPSPIEIEFDSQHSTGSRSFIVGVKAITDINKDLRTLLYESASAPAEPFWFRGAHGDPVEGFIIPPPGMIASENKKYPVKFLIHGGPEGAWGDDWSYRWNAELFAAPTSATPSGFVVIMINFHGSTGYGQKFIDAINGDWGGAPFEDLMKGLDYAEEHYPFIDKNRECALGASYGGYAINWILGHTDRFKCLVSHDGMFDAVSAWGTTEELWFNDWEFKGTPYDNRALYEKWSPSTYAKNFKTPTLVIHGQKDYRLDVSQGLELFTTLQMEGVPSEMLYFPDEGHWVLKPQNSELWYKTVNDWVDQWTKK